MTIIIGAKDSEGKVWIASDRRVTFSGGGYLDTKCGKWINLDNRLMMGIAGDARAQNTLEGVAHNKAYLKKQKFDNIASIIEFMNDCKLTFAEADLIATSEAPTAHPIIQNHFLLATKTELFSATGDFSVLQHYDIVAIGSGADFAYGAWHTICNVSGMLENPSPGLMPNVLQDCIRAAAAFDAGCSPNMNILCVSDLPSPEKEKPNADRNSRKTGSRKGRGRKDNTERAS